MTSRCRTGIATGQTVGQHRDRRKTISDLILDPYSQVPQQAD